MTPMLMMVLMMVRILPKVTMINDHDDGGGDDNDINVRQLTSTLMRMTTKAMIINGNDERLSRARCLANQG